MIPLLIDGVRRGFRGSRVGLAWLLLVTAAWAQEPVLRVLRNSGPSNARINLVVLGDGYVPAQQENFFADAQRKIDLFVSNEALVSFRDYINGYAVFTASNESGTDRPGEGITRDTYYDAGFDTTINSRLLYIRTSAGRSRVDTVLRSAVPEYDIVLMLVNTTVYGGAGGFPAVASLHASSDEIIFHETGHSFAGLADEYVDEASAPFYAPRESVNATQQTERSAIPWRAFIRDSTPVPTTEFTLDVNHVGSWEGSYYRTKGFYRPIYDSKMRSLGRPFGPVNLRAFAEAAHRLNVTGATVPPVLSQPPANQTVMVGATLTLEAIAEGTPPFTYQWTQNGKLLAGATTAKLTLTGATAADAGVYTLVVLNGAGATTSALAVVKVNDPDALAFPVEPQPQAIALGGAANFSVAVGGNPTPSLQWRRNGVDVAGATSLTFAVLNAQPTNAGIYSALATNRAGELVSAAAILGVITTRKVAGSGEELMPANIRHSNGNTFDQVLLTGAAEAITADYDPDPAKNQITRTSFVDLDDDIVQVEFSGPGTLSLVLDNPTGPAAPVNYNQDTKYMKGHAGIVIAGATEATNVSVFSVGKANAVNQALFKDGVKYDGIADLAFIAILSSNGKFGGVRTANANYFAAKGLTGLYAPGVDFQGPVYLGDITAFEAATPIIEVGSVSDARITGGDLAQANGAAVQVNGLTQLKFTPGSDSHGTALPAQANQAVLKQDGVDVTAQVVVNP